MDSSLEPFTYTPLSSLRATRIVILEPSVRLNDPIQCRLEEILLDDRTSTARRYEALSYVWGEAVGTRAIKCTGGSAILVTPNCESALRYLRHAEHERALWIDAICIDQASAPEKAAQIPLMGNVYTMSVRVIIWLGSDGDEMRSLFRHVNRGKQLAKWYKGISVYRSRFLTPLPFIRWLWNHVYQDRKQVDLLASHKWFWRIWTVQEQYFAPDAVLVLGRSQCSYSAFYSYTVWCCSVNAVPLVYRQRKLFSTFLDSLFSAAERARVHPREVARFLPYWLALMRASNTATDPRDTVYGLLGILRSNWPDWPSFPVDYELSPARVYEEFAKYIVRHTGTLDILASKAPKAEDYEPLDGLPSWVPDMRGVVVGATDSEITARMAFLPAKALATSQSVVDVATLDQSLVGQIRVRGNLIDEVGRAPSLKIPPGLGAIDEWEEAFVSAGLEVPWRAFAQIRGTKHTVVSKLIDQLCTWSVPFLFLTMHSRLGVANFDVRRGDAVVLLAGYNCPVVLRGCKDGTHTFMGRVAMEGTMWGEVWENGKEVSELETFILI